MDPKCFETCDLCGHPVPRQTLKALPDEPDMKPFPALANAARLFACITCLMKHEEMECA